MEVFRTHPSVRVKGTEDSYEPIGCNIITCAKTNVHLHCPFCVKSDSFYDPVILKAHYRVKHVDKGIEFAGLKILRCCDHCMIVGSIKGSKEFKGAHWHCYNCRNGFNRRDEALKHYKTHFRNPMTTFQIQITHDINQMMSMSESNMLDPADTVMESQHQQTLTTTVGEDGTFVTGTQAMPWIVSTETVVSSGATQQGGFNENIMFAQDESQMPSQSVQQGSMVSTHDNHMVITQDGNMVLEQSEQQVCTDGEGQYYIVGEDGHLRAAGGTEVTAVTSSDPDQMEVTEIHTLDWENERQDLLYRLAETEEKYQKLLTEKNQQSATEPPVDWQNERQDLVSKLAGVEQKCSSLEEERKKSDDYFKAKIVRLEVEVQGKEKQIVSLQQREKELIEELKSGKNETQVSNILDEMKNKQEELMNQYMSKLKKTVTSESKNSQSNGLIKVISNDPGLLKTVLKAENTQSDSSIVTNKVLYVKTAPKNVIANKGVINVKNELLKHPDNSTGVHVRAFNVQGQPKSPGTFTKTIVLKTLPKQIPTKTVVVSSPSSSPNLANRLPLSKYFSASPGKNKPDLQNNANLITTESGSQYMVFVDSSPAPHNDDEVQAGITAQHQVVTEGNVQSQGNSSVQEASMDDQVVLDCETSQFEGELVAMQDNEENVCSNVLQEVTMETDGEVQCRGVSPQERCSEQPQEIAIVDSVEQQGANNQVKIVSCDNSFDTENITSSISDQMITRSDDIVTKANNTESNDVTDNRNHVAIEHGYVTTGADSSVEETNKVSSTQAEDNESDINVGFFASSNDIAEGEANHSSLNNSNIEAGEMISSNHTQSVKRKASVTPESSPTTGTRPKRQRKSLY